MKTSVNKKGQLKTVSGNKTKIKKAKKKKLSPKKNINTIAKAMEDYPLKDELMPSFANKKDYKEVQKYRVSMADAWNGDGHLYKTISQLLHIHYHLHRGIPGDYKEDILPISTVTRTRENGTTYKDRKDYYFEQRCQMYADDIKALRDEFIYLYNFDSYDDAHDNFNGDYKKSQEENDKRRVAAFKKLSEISPSMWI